MEKLTIIDTTSLIFSACVTLGDDTDNYKKAKKNFDKWFEDILIETEADCYIAFTDQSSFRRDLLPSYKADRKALKPKFFSALKRDCCEKWGIVSNQVIESDDLCLINHNYYKNDFDCTIAAIDGDLRQYPAKFYNYKKNKKEGVEDFEEITEDEANMTLWQFVLAGSHNGLKGLKGCGEGTATGYLGNFKPSQYTAAVMAAYVKGINKNTFNTSRSVKGLGMFSGLVEFNTNFISSYLLRTEEEAKQFTEEKVIFNVTKYKEDETELAW